MSRSLGIVMALLLLPPSASGQVPAKPIFPAINPANARLDVTINELDSPILGVVFPHGQGPLVAASEGGPLLLWSKDVHQGIRSGDAPTHVIPGHEGVLTALASGGGRVVSGGSDGMLRFWDFEAQKVALSLKVGHAIRAVVVSPHGQLVAAAGDGPEVKTWDGTGKPGPIFSGHRDWVMALAMSEDGKRLASAGYEGVVRIWEIATGKKLVEAPALPMGAPAGTSNTILTLAFSPDGTTLAVGGSDASIHLLSTNDGKIVRTLTGHGSSVKGLAFHPGGTLLVSASKDRTVRLWNPTNGQALKTLEGHTAWVEGVVFLTDGTRLATAGADATVRIWDLR